MNTKIFVPVMGSDESKIATEKAVELAAILNAKLVAIHVLDKESLAKLQRYKIFIEEEASGFGNSLQKDAEKYLNYVQQTAAQFHVDTETVLLEGDPFLEIQHYIQKEATQNKILVIARTMGAETFTDSFGSLEKKLLRSKLSVVVVGG
ncbi:MAG: universal stress protein [Brevinema sp.]